MQTQRLAGVLLLALAGGLGMTACTTPEPAPQPERGVMPPSRVVRCHLEGKVPTVYLAIVNTEPVVQTVNARVVINGVGVQTVTEVPAASTNAETSGGISGDNPPLRYPGAKQAGHFYGHYRIKPGAVFEVISPVDTVAVDRTVYDPRSCKD